MRVIVDANVWISYLLTLGRDTTIAKALQFILSAHVTLVMPFEIENELRHSIEQKPYLSSRIMAQEVERLMERIRQVAILPPPLDLPHASYVSDHKDDYLIAYGLLHNCDYLITGDGHLLALRQLRRLTILDPSQFWGIVEK
jgi:putative PIN family toxin of toxin-antitoxin system